MDRDAPVIRVVWGTATGPTDTAAYDAALADAGIHNYNLVTVSSIIPASSTVESVGTAPDLGPAGNRLTVIQARSTVAGPGQATAGLGWATGDGPGVFYEAEGEFDPDEARVIINRGLEAGRTLRDWPFADEGRKIVSTRSETAYASAVVLGVFGTSDPIP